MPLMNSEQKCGEGLSDQDMLGDSLRGWKKLDHWLESGRHWVQQAKVTGRAHPCKVQCQQKHDMGGEYNDEVPRRILHNRV
jgi:hypothetical protein